MTARSSNYSVTAALLSMLVQKETFSEVKKKITFTQMQILPENIFPEWFGHKTIEPIGFWKTFMKKKSSNWSFQRKVGFNLERAQTSEHCCVYCKLLDYKMCSNFRQHQSLCNGSSQLCSKSSDMAENRLCAEKL